MATLADIQAGVSLGDASRASGYWGQAVTHYKAAGQMGADQVGPAIDKRTGGTTAGLTQRAWDMNGLLAKLNDSDSAGQDDADQAKKFIDQIVAWYIAANAYSVAPAAHADVKLPPLVVTSTILPAYGAMPSIGQALPKPVAAAPASRPAAAPVAKAAQFVPPPIVVSSNKSPVSGKNILAAAALAVPGGLFFGLPGAVFGALGGIFGSKLLKW